MLAPLIEFAQFAHPQRWWLRLGPPPWLDDPRRGVRALRVSLAMGVSAGLATGLHGGSLIAFEVQTLSPALGAILFCAQGVWFGAAVMLPLSRWLNRSMLWSLASIFVAEAAWWAAIMFASFVEFDDPLRTDLSCGFVGGLVIAVWIGDPEHRPPVLWWIGAAATGAVSCAIAGFLLKHTTASLTPWTEAVFPTLDEVGLVLFVTQSVFHMGMAVYLGSRLWSAPS